jgi:hypothetical protein
MLLSCGEQEVAPTDGTTDTTEGGVSEDGTNTSIGGAVEVDPLLAFATVVANSTPDEVSCVITTVNAGTTLTARTTLTATSNTVEYQLLNTLDIDDDTTEMTRTETVTAKSGENTVVLSGLSIAEDNLADDYTIEGGVLTATVTNPSAFFGTTVSYTQATVTVTTDSGVLTAMTVSYTAANGSTVTITATFA